MNKPALLHMDRLSVEFRTRTGVVKTLEDVSLRVARGEIVGVVGESGSGKSVMAHAIMGILDRAGRVTAGSIVLGGMDLLGASEADLRDVRGREVSMIFQSPRTALNPIRQVGRQIEDVLRRHAAITRRQLPRRAVEALSRVRIPDPAKRYHSYPFELSGGLCQRVGIATALACEPSLLIADEPTTGLDVTTQATIMDLLRELAVGRRMATLLITHDLHLAAEVCDRIIVMHAGHVIESAPTAKLFREPSHPYTAKLIAATPSGQESIDAIAAIPGSLPDLRATNLPPCRFAYRCDRHTRTCDRPSLTLTAVGEGHEVACRRPL